MSYHITAQAKNQSNNVEVSDQLQKSHDIVVGVVDTGVDIQHEQLKDSIWINEGEMGLDQFGRDKSRNGIDDDGNGYKDDIHGWNFVDDNNKVLDENGHGTHVAGIIKKQFEKVKQNKYQTIKFMVLKFYDHTVKGEQSLINGVKAMNYAIRMNARVLNYSGGGVDYDERELFVLQKAARHKIILVAAAGNNHTNSDYNKYYPASYNLSNIIAVASIDRDLKLSAFSNFGLDSVDIAAPGNAVLSAMPRNKSDYLSGTSQSTAFVTGRLSSIILNCWDCSLDFYKSFLFSQAKKLPALKGLIKTQLALVEE